MGRSVIKSTILSIMLALVVILGFKTNVFAEKSGTCGENATWTLSDEGELVISGTGEVSRFIRLYPNSDDQVACSDVIQVIISEGITSIGEDVFWKCWNLKTIQLPDSLISIGDGAFSLCYKLDNIELPNKIEYIGKNAFEGCTSISSIVLPDSIKDINSLSFYGCTGLTEISIPGSVKIIDQKAFDGCSSLTSVTFSEGLTDIGDYAFSGCDNLANIQFPDSLDSIGESAFSFCDELSSVRIPEGISKVGVGAFNYCNKIKEIYVDEKNKTYDSRNNCNAIIETNTDTLVIACNNTIVPDNVRIIEKKAFEGCNDIKEVSIPSGVTEIRTSAFEGCKKIEEIQIPNGVTEVGWRAFWGCENLTSVEIEASDSDDRLYIGSDAFYACINLANVCVLREKVYFQGYVFQNNAIIKGYKGSTAELYATEYGHEFIVLPKEDKQSDDKPAAGTTDKPASDVKPIEQPTTADKTPSVTKPSVGSTVKVGKVSYVIGKNNTVQYKKNANKNATKVTIPATLKIAGETYKVTSIAKSAFKGNKKLKSITIGKNVATIGKSAFQDCKKLSSVTISTKKLTSKSVGKNAFKGINAKAKIKVPKTKLKAYKKLLKSKGITGKKQKITK